MGERCHKNIGVKSKTKKRLDAIKLCAQESYDNVINRMLDNFS